MRGRCYITVIQPKSTLYIMDKLTADKEKTNVAADDQYRGADINAADDGKVNERLIKQDMKIRNSNPHSKGL